MTTEGSWYRQRFSIKPFFESTPVNSNKTRLSSSETSSGIKIPMSTLTGFCRGHQEEYLPLRKELPL